MKWKFRGDRPIYTQLVEHLQRGILTGGYPAGSAVPPVRTLAIEAEVNPNTMQRALAELEAQGLIQTHRTSGRTVTEDKRMIESLKENLARAQVETFFEGMRSIGVSESEAARLIADVVRQEGAEPPMKSESEERSAKRKRTNEANASDNDKEVM